MKMIWMQHKLKLARLVNGRKQIMKILSCAYIVVIEIIWVNSYFQERNPTTVEQCNDTKYSDKLLSEKPT